MASMPCTAIHPCGFLAIQRFLLVVINNGMCVEEGNVPTIDRQTKHGA